MQHLTNLFKIIELTRSQPQYGYALAGIQQDDLSNLAEHHYLVTFIGWQLARNLKARGAAVNVEKVLEFCLIHDLGELFGGDIAMPYARVNPKAREHAKAFETENQKYLSEFFDNEKSYFQNLSNEIMNAQSDECIIAKIADYIEVTHYKFFVKAFSQFDLELVETKLQDMISRIKDMIAKQVLSEFVTIWAKEIGTKDIPQILYEERGQA